MVNLTDLSINHLMLHFFGNLQTFFFNKSCFLCSDLKVGQYVTAVVDQVKNEGRLVRFSVSPPSSQDCAEATQGWNLTNLLPGLLVKATVKKVKNRCSAGACRRVCVTR